MVLLRRVTTARPVGYARLDRDDGQIEESDVLQCVHCGCIWRVVPGSGIRRGWCLACGGAVCGDHDCMAVCRPLSQDLRR